VRTQRPSKLDDHQYCTQNLKAQIYRGQWTTCPNTVHMKQLGNATFYLRNFPQKQQQGRNAGMISNFNSVVTYRPKFLTTCQQHQEKRVL